MITRLSASTPSVRQRWRTPASRLPARLRRSRTFLVEKCSVEERDDAPFVLLGFRGDARDVLPSGYFPDLFGVAGNRVEALVRLHFRAVLALFAEYEEGCRGRDLRDLALQARRRQRAGEERGRKRDGTVPEDCIAHAVVRAPVAERLPARTLGHDRPEHLRVRRGMDQHLAADREADAADPLGVDVLAPAEVRGGSTEISIADPAEGVRITFARAFAAAVEEQDAVPVPNQHPCLLLRARPSGRNDHRRAVPRPDEPALEAQSVARGEENVLGLGAEVRRWDMCSQSVRDGVRDRRGEQDDRDCCENGDRNKAASEIPPPDCVMRVSSPPEHGEAKAEQQHAAEERERAAVVVTRHAAGGRVVDSLDPAESSEEAETERETRPRTGAQPAGHRRSAEDRRERQLREPACEVI